jgi:cytoskeletal protein CcmA (bactofilin family)
MGFFKKSVSSEVKRTGLTIIAKGNKIAGEMVITGKLHIDGTVEGSITSIENVSIGKTGIISGKLKAKNVTVNGLLEGEVECDHLHITAGGKVKANVCSIDLTMEAQSHFFGESREKTPLVAAVQNPAITSFAHSASQVEHAQQADSLLDNLPNTVTSYEQTDEVDVQTPVVADNELGENVSLQSSVEDANKGEEQSYELDTSYSKINDSQLADLSFNTIVNQDLTFIGEANLAATFTPIDSNQDKIAIGAEIEQGSEVDSAPIDKSVQKKDDSEKLASVNTVAEAKPKKKSRAKAVDENTTVMELKI